MSEQISNNAVSSLVAAISPSDTTIQIHDASTFPGSGNFRLLIDTEYLLCTAISGTTLTVQRSVEGSSANSHAASATVACILTAAAIAEYVSENAGGAVSSVAGRTGAVVLSASDVSGLATVGTSGAYSDLSGKPSLGTAAALNVGTSANNVVQLTSGDKLPAVDGSLLTNISGSGIAAVVDDTAPQLGGNLNLGGFNVGGVTPTQLSYVDATSSIQTQINAKAATSSLAASATTDTTNASNISSGTLNAARLPNPGVSSLGGVQSKASASHQFLTAISTSGVVSAAQPAASDVSGLAASATTDTTNAANISSGTLPAARLPNPSASTLGGVQSKASTTHQFLTQISTGGVVSAAQPDYTDLTGLPTLGTAAALNVGTGANDVVQLDGSSKLPAVNGSQLTGVLATATPGGSNGELQWNNEGVLAGTATSPASLYYVGGDLVSDYNGGEARISAGGPIEISDGSGNGLSLSATELSTSSGNQGAVQFGDSSTDYGVNLASSGSSLINVNIDDARPIALTVGNGSSSDLSIHSDGTIGNDANSVKVRADFAQVEPASGSVSYAVSQGWVAGQAATISWTGGGTDANPVAGFGVINGVNINFNEAVSDANGSGWVYGGVPFDSLGSITGTGPTGAGQTQPTLDTSGLLDSGSNEWDTNGGTITTTFVDGTNNQAMIATITVVGSNGEWILNGNNPTHNETAANVGTWLGIDTGAGDTCTLAFTAPDTYIYTITTYSADFSTQVATAVNDNLVDGFTDGTTNVELTQGNIHGNNGGTVSAFTPATLGDWTVSYDPTNNQMVFVGYNGATLQTATLAMS